MILKGHVGCSGCVALRIANSYFYAPTLPIYREGAEVEFGEWIANAQLVPLAPEILVAMSESAGRQLIELSASPRILVARNLTKMPVAAEQNHATGLR